MRRITFVDPVDSMQGNLSGRQDLRYALNNNKAFESPAGQKNYAKNYQTRYIGARRASDGLKYFAVKTKSATHTTQAAMMVMALLGGTGAMYAACIKNKSTELYTKLVASYENRSPEHESESMRQWFMNIVNKQLFIKAQTIGLSSQLSLNNPWWNDTATGSLSVPVSNKIKNKFLQQLGVGVFTFAVDNDVITAYTGSSFDDINGSSVMDYKGIWNESTIGSTTYILYKGYYLTKEGVYATVNDDPGVGDQYIKTSVPPQA